jgi:effector-binding domain-containing protein
MAHYRCTLYDDLYAWLARQDIKPAGPEMALYHNEDYTEQDIDMEVGIAVPPSAMTRSAGRVRVYELPATLTMSIVAYLGDPWDVVNAISALYAWMGVNDHATNGPCREIHLFGRENDLTTMGNQVVEVQLPIQPR